MGECTDVCMCVCVYVWSECYSCVYVRLCTRVIVCRVYVCRGITVYGSVCDGVRGVCQRGCMYVWVCIRVVWETVSVWIVSK